VSRPVVVHGYLRKARETSADGLAWLDQLPDLVAELRQRWGLEITGTPYEGGMCAWVAPVRRAGDDAVLKITWPHPEAATEAAALRVWDGAGAVRLLAEDSEAWAMLLERCVPGTPLREAGRPNECGLAIGADLLNALWSKAIPTGEVMPFDSMGPICDGWADSAERRAERYGAVLRTLGTDPGILALGIGLLRTLPRSAERQVVVHGDFNPGNVLAARRAPYLAIDPKPMVGDPAYDPWPLVAQLDWPFRSANAAWVVSERIRRLADLLDLTPARIAAWGIARDVEGGLWAAEDNNAADGAKWIRSATIIAPMLG
jgi:streptomycin 6-kinase